MTVHLRTVRLEYKSTRSHLKHNNLWELTCKTAKHYNKIRCLIMEDAISHMHDYQLISKFELHESCETNIFLHVIYIYIMHAAVEFCGTQVQ